MCHMCYRNTKPRILLDIPELMAERPTVLDFPMILTSQEGLQRGEDISCRRRISESNAKEDPSQGVALKHVSGVVSCCHVRACPLGPPPACLNKSWKESLFG